MFMYRKNCSTHKLFLGSLFFLFSGVLHAEIDFIKSFVNFYEVSNEGRFTHEYHPFLLKKTAKSFDQLENELIKNDFLPAHRMIIMGYEKAAAPSYFFNPFMVKGETINDETLHKTLFGITQECHNLFGFMTGFLFRNMPEFPHLYTKHIGAKNIILFHDHAYRFQQDFFGNFYYYIKEKEQALHKAAYQKSHADFLEECIQFWNQLYYQNINNKDQHVAGTQDILFTIEHARSIKDSVIPLKDFFVGADITYPINQTTLRSKKATVNAQEFVKTFVDRLKPINGQNTLYVFRSFVDGVGKSTMLGNIKNWMKHTNSIEKYEAIDNASSQFAEIFQFDKQVFIADLPAQLSHFTYKPDGLVFVNLKHLPTVSVTEEEIFQFYRKHEKEIIKKFYTVIDELCLQKGVALLPNLADNPLIVYSKNLQLLEIKKCEQIPFEYKDQWYLLDPKKQEIRICLPLAQAPSEGLKNTAPEQMLFMTGVRFPDPYKHFLDRFMKQCKDVGVEQIVFVDFLSMYARSSREVIRINYLIQQIKTLFYDADYRKSLYAGFASNATLLHQLNQQDQYKKTIDYILYEALTRAALFELIQEEKHQAAKPITLVSLLDAIKQKLKMYDVQSLHVIEELVHKKLSITHQLLQEQYKNNKEFVHLLSADLTQLPLLSRCIEKQLRNIVLAHKNPWKQLPKEVQEQELVSCGPCDRLVPMDNGHKMRALFVFDFDTRDLSMRAELFSLLKKWWIPSLLSAFAVEHDERGFFKTESLKYPLAPLVIKRGQNRLWYVLQKQMHSDEKLSVPSDFNTAFLNMKESGHGKVEYRVYDDLPYICSWETTDLTSGIYNFGYSSAGNMYVQKQPFFLNVAFTDLIKPKINQLDPSMTIPLSTLYACFERQEKYSFFSYCEREIEKKAKNTRVKNKKSVDTSEVKNSSQETEVRFCNSTLFSWMKQICYLFAQTMRLVPHPQSPFALHQTSIDDFYTALMLSQKIMMPQYGHIFCKEPLWKKEELHYAKMQLRQKK
jgi:hypothetical protein